MCERVGGVAHKYMKACVFFFSADILPKAELLLNEIRNQIFIQLQPQLKCELGK